MRNLRYAHATVSPNITFGSHQANHMAIGALFLGRGRYTFGTNNLAVASLLCAFYPIFPKDAMDNSAHLQAFRHLWTFAAEPRCLITRDAETHELIVADLDVHLEQPRDEWEDKVLRLRTPQLIPELNTIEKIVATNDQYWPLVLDFEHNEGHRATIKKDQTVFLRRRGLLNQHNTSFMVELATLGEPAAGASSEVTSTPASSSSNPFSDIFNLEAFRDLHIGPAQAANLFPRGWLTQNVSSSSMIPSEDVDEDKAQEQRHQLPLEALLDIRTTGVDDALALAADAECDDRERLLGLKRLIAHNASRADQTQDEEQSQEVDGVAGSNWLPSGTVQLLKARILRRIASEKQVEDAAQ